MFDSLIQSIESGFSDLMPQQFCLPCFLKGLATGLVIGIAAIALLPEELFIAALVLGVIGLAKMAAEWKNMNDPQKSEALGNLVGGALAGGVGKGGFEMPVPRPMVTPEGMIAWDTAMVAVGGTGRAAATGAIGGSGTAAMMSGGGEGGGGDQQAPEEPEFKADPKQLQSKFKHAEDFGVSGNYNSENAAKFDAALKEHVANPNTQTIQGTYRGQEVIHKYNPSTSVDVMMDKDGNFISGWKLNQIQAEKLTTTGKLGGG